jgi:hypothetical protein
MPNLVDTFRTELLKSLHASGEEIDMSRFDFYVAQGWIAEEDGELVIHVAKIPNEADRVLLESLVEQGLGEGHSLQ